MRNTNFIEIVILAAILLLVWTVAQSKVSSLVKPVEVRVSVERVKL